MGRVADERKLRHQILRRRIAVCFILRIHFIAKTVRALVEHHDHLLARPVLGELEQHVAKAEHGAHRRADLVGQRRQREIGAKNVAGAVDQQETGLFGCGRGRERKFGHGGHRV